MKRFFHTISHCLLSQKAGYLIAAAILATLGIVHPSGASHTNIAGDWYLDEGLGQVAGDASGHSNNGQLGSTPSPDTSDPTWIAGRFGAAALRFDGNDFVEVADSATLESPTITAEAWVKGRGSPGSFRYVLSKGTSACAVASYAIYTGASGGLVFYISNGSIDVPSPDAGTGLWDDVWHHVAGTFDGSTVRLYVDGVEIGSGTPTTLSIGYGLPSNERFYIGAYRGTCDLMFAGDIDEVRVWRRALAPFEVAQRAQGQELAPTPITCNGIPVTILGTAGNDILLGTEGPDIISGLGGNDTIKGQAGNDVICGGNGNDILIGESGNDILIGGSGNDRLYGGRGRDRLYGLQGRDHMDGGPHFDTCHVCRPSDGDTTVRCEKVTGPHRFNR